MIFAVAIVAILVTAGAAALLLSTGGKGDSDKVNVVASFYPLAYMAKTIGGDKVSVSTLIPENTEVHSWSPSAADILAADKADLFIYNGASLDMWVENQLLPAIDTSDTTVVKTTAGMVLHEGSGEDAVEDTRFFVFDNDKQQLLVYDSHDGAMVLSQTFPFGLNMTATYSGYFDPAIEATNSAGYKLLFIPNLNNVTVLNTGLHGDHFHDAEVVTVIDVGKPLHAHVSEDGQYVAFALDNDNGVLIIPVNAPAEYKVVLDPAGSSSTNHATVVFDDDNLVYYADMRETGNNPENLMIVDAETGEIVLSGGYAGNAPHGGQYSSVTGKVYLDCADGLAVVGPDGYEKTIPYGHDGGRLSRSWISENGTWVISYVGDTGRGLAYASIVAYDIVNESLVAEIDVEVQQKANHGWPASILLEDGRTVAISDPATGKVLLIDVATGTVDEIDLEAEAPLMMRLVQDVDSHNLWVVTGDNMMYLIDPEHGHVELEMEVPEPELGRNIVMSAVSPTEGEGHSHDHDHDHEGVYDPHTWISPFNARQQAKAIYDALVAEDPDNADYYAERWEELDQKLADLDERYQNELAETSADVIFVTHEAYGYLADRYGFEQEGAIGISADEQPSASALAHLVEEMMEHGIYVVYLDPVYTDSYANTLKNNVESLSGHSVQVLKLYLMTGTVDGLDCLGQMEANLESLKTGLGASG